MVASCADIIEDSAGSISKHSTRTSLGRWREAPWPATHPLACPAAQSLSDPEKVKHSIAVAERGLSDLQAYTAAQTSGSSIDLYLKGACD